MPGPIVRRLTQLLDVVGGVIGITQGGTGATSASAARTALGLQIGTNVQAFSATLAGLSSATYAAGTILGGNDDGGGVPTALTVGTGLSVSGGSLICTVSGGGGWSSDGSKATTTLLVRIGSATPPTLYNAYWLAATRDDGVSCANGFATFSDTAGNGSIRNLFRARGTSAIPAAVQTGDTIGIDQWSARNAAGSTQTVGRRVHTVSSTSFTTHPGDTETLELRVPDATSNTTVYTATGSGWTFGVPVTLTGALTGDGTTWSVGSSSGANGRLDSTSHATKGILYLNGTNAQVTAAGVFSCPGAGANSETFGAGASCTGGVDGIAIGNGASVTSDAGIAIGRLASANNLCIAIGRSASAPGANQCVIGSRYYAILNVFFNGVTNPSPNHVVINGAGASGPNVGGGNIAIAGGKGTGNATTNGEVRIQVSTPGVSGWDAQSLATVVHAQPGSKLGFFGVTPVTQPAAVADATNATDVITQLNALLSRLRSIGLIAP